MNKIAIIDYGVGNIGSIQNMINRLSGESYLVDNRNDIIEADKIILPGVGHFDHGMKMLRERSLVEPLTEYALVLRKPILGICLGAQLMTLKSEEGESKGLGFFNAEVKHFNKLFDKSVERIPHMGWNEVEINEEDKFCKDLPRPTRFYFVHSYYLEAKNEREILMTTSYGGTKFTSAMYRDNIFAVQFHPEKSHKYGLKLMENYLKI